MKNTRRESHLLEMLSTSWRRPLGFVAIIAFCALARAGRAELWNLSALQQPPIVEWGPRDGSVQEVYYSGEPFRGKPTRVFGYLGRPATADPAARLPAVVLVHGGGGQAFRAWAERWAQRGYVALAMDLSGNGPGKVRMPDGGPPLGNPNIFLATDNDDAFREGWPYHAVAAAIRGASLLAALPEVDPSRLGLTGISWGGFISCIVAGLDHRLKVAVPVYGCGFLQDSSFWKKDLIDPMAPDQRSRWVRLYEPSRYLGDVTCPILFVTGANDPRFYLDSLQRSAELVQPELRHLAVVVGLKHGHLFNLPEVDGFIDGVLKKTGLPPRLTPPVPANGVMRSALAGAPPVRAELNYASTAEPWVDRKWKTLPAVLGPSSVSASLPAERPIVAFFSLVDAKGAHSTSSYAEIAQ